MMRSMIFLLLATGVACGGGGGYTPPEPGDRMFKGTIAAQNTTGIVVIIVKSDMSSASVTGTIARVVTATEIADLTGDYRPATTTSGGMTPNAAFSLKGGGWKMSAVISGTNGDHVIGSYSDSHGNSGKVSAVDSTSTDVTRYCGTYSGDDQGTWNFQVAGHVASGAFAGFESGTLSGSASGSSVSLNFYGDTNSGTAPGTISGSAVSGTWKTSDGANSGSWMGMVGTCAAASTGGMSSSHLADGKCMKVGKWISCCIDHC